MLLKDFGLNFAIRAVSNNSPNKEYRKTSKLLATF